MFEWLQILLNPLFDFFIVTSVLIGWFYIIFYTKTAKTKELTDKIIFIALGILFGISFVLFLLDHLLPISFTDLNGDVSNWATLVIEIGIGIAIGSTIFLYSNFKQNKSSEDITDVKDISKKLDGMMEKMGSIVQKQEEHAEVLEKRALLQTKLFLDPIITRLELLENLYPKITTGYLDEENKIDKEIEGLRQTIQSMVEFGNTIQIDKIRDRELSYDINQILSTIQRYCETTIFESLPPSKFTTNGLIKDIEDVYSRIPDNAFDAIPKSRLI